ncbi:MAG: MOSC domain-containing protein [Pseudomonadota bacterium]
MMARHARLGRIDWIGLRVARRAEIAVVDVAQLSEAGLVGDHAKPGKRALTLIQAEHLPVIAALSGHNMVLPALFRRNIVVSGLNLLGFRRARLNLGEAVIEITGPCPPCSRMEEALGPGGYTGMRGHGGVYASVVRPGSLKIGDMVRPVID